MTTLQIVGNSPAAVKFLEYARTLPFVREKPERAKKSQLPQHVLDYEANLKPMTMEEYNAMIDEALEDFRAGRHISQEEMGRWIDSL